MRKLLLLLAALFLWASPSHAGVIPGRYAETGAVVSTFTVVGSGAGNIVLVGAVSGKQLCVLSMVNVSSMTATGITYQSSSTAITPQFNYLANGGMVLPYEPAAWFCTTAGQPLEATTTTGGGIAVHIDYAQQ